MIYTSNYNNAKTGNLISISGDKGKSANYEGKYCTDLEPKILFWKIWHENIGKIDPVINETWYINQYYYQVLKKINLSNTLNSLGNDPILLCYESPYEFCHRFLFASFVELKIGICVPELTIDEYGNYITNDYKPCYIKDKMKRILQIHRDI